MKRGKENKWEDLSDCGNTPQWDEQAIKDAMWDEEYVKAAIAKFDEGVKKAEEDWESKKAF